MPVPASQYLIVLARATGWTADFIRWELPLSQGWAHFHTARLLDGIPMTLPGGTASEQAWWDQVTSRIKSPRN